jgi:hypothetical protein
MNTQQESQPYTRYSTLDRLHRWNMVAYDTCARCNEIAETYEHIWECSHTREMLQELLEETKTTALEYFSNEKLFPQKHQVFNLSYILEIQTVAPALLSMEAKLMKISAANQESPHQ